MKPQTLIHFFNERNSLLRKYILNTSAKEIEESIHKLRVEIKKIQFVFLYSSFFNHHFPVKGLYNPYHNVFKRTGKIRELQLLQQLIKQFFTEVELKKQLKELAKNEKDLTKKLISHINKDLKAISKSAKRTNELFIKFPVFNEDEFFLSLSLTIQNKFNKINAVELHASRKTLKAVIYSKHLIPGTAIFRKLLNAPAADQLQEFIGVWHDKVLLLEWAEKNLKQGKYLAEIKTLKTSINVDFRRVSQASKLLLKG